MSQSLTKGLASNEPEILVRLEHRDIKALFTTILKVLVD